MIKEQRKIKGMTLNELEGFTGSTASYLSQIENGNKIPSEKVIFSLAYFLDDRSNVNSNYQEELITEYAVIKDVDRNSLWSGFQKFQRFNDNLLQKMEESMNESVGITNKNKFKLKKGTLKAEPLQEPYFDLKWLLTQKEYEVFYGRDYNINLGEESKSDKVFYPRLRDEDLKIIHGIIEAYISNKYERRKKGR
ncbi:helix-turn-helix domain-containing protein [Oceanobacillus kimchii]|uniref:helix-turn-helix domain-containing protein n=1 Tax=Oceanobacillus kimchii TaxID=746691 RepID=UPI001AD9498B|nr:helix-turn-helix transcriptional regulator [Oceanobacillus kimchii]